MHTMTPMKKLPSPRLPATVLAAFTLLALTSCDVTPPDQMRPDEDANKYFDYVPTSKRLVSQTDSQVEHALGPPIRVHRLDDDTILWDYDRRFCESEARFIYRVMTLRFEGHKLVSMHPPEPR